MSDKSRFIGNVNLDRLPLFAADIDIAVAVVGKKHAVHWKRFVLPVLEARSGFPRYDKLHEGRPVPLVKLFYESYLGVSSGYLSRGADGEERLGLWRKSENWGSVTPAKAGKEVPQDRRARAKANSEAWAEKKKKALDEFRAKKRVTPPSSDDSSA